MTPGFPDDPTLTHLRALPRVAPTRDAADRIRARSHLALARSRQPANVGRRFQARVVDGAFVAVCLVYLSGAVAQAWRLLSGLR
jgi:hypothetical protein